MRKQDYLLEIIKNMRPNEKRYFKLFSSIQPGEKRYLQLFDALEKTERYDPKALCRQLNLTNTQLADDKFYLSQVLLRSLRFYDEETSGSTPVFQLYMEVRALLDRKMYDYALEVTDKIISRAKQMEAYSFLPTMITIKQSCLAYLRRYDEMPALGEELNKINRTAHEVFEIAQLSFAVARIEMQRRKTAELKKLMQHPLLKKKPEQLLSLRSQIAWFTIMLRYYTLEKDAGKILEISRKTVKHYEAHPEIKIVNPLAHLYSYPNLAEAEAEAGNYNEALKVIQKFSDQLNKPAKYISRNDVDSMKTMATRLKAFMMIKMQRYDEGVVYCEEVLKSDYLKSPYDRYELVFNYALCLLHSGRAGDAFKQLDELLKENTDIRMDMQEYLRPLMVLVHLQQQSYDIIPYFIKAAKSWMQRKKISNAELENFFRLTGSMAKAQSPAQRQHALLQLNESTRTGSLKNTDKVLHLQGWLNGFPEKNIK
jgi:tetratricopeptide (TPR) repeat protein